jgi:DNA-binding IclR family transcriptional regulator
MATQTLERAIGLLRLIAAAPEGSRLVDLQRQSGLTKPTVHRILETLVAQDFVARDGASRRYRLGPEIGLLASSMNAKVDLRDLCHDHMLEVAQLTGDTAFLSVRSGYDAVCIARQSGSYPVKAFTVDVGTRRPLGVGAGGIVLLAALDPVERAIAYESIRRALPSSARITVPAMKAAVDDAERLGYAYSDGFVLAGVRALAVPLRDPAGKVVAALSLAAIRERISRARAPQLLSVLQSHAASIERRIRMAAG